MNRSSIFHRLRVAVDRPYRQALISAAWQEGIPAEITFWDNYVATQGGMWPEDFAIRMDPQLPLQPNVIEMFPATVGTELKILDVGAGPLTYLGKVWPGHRLAITAVDPLADEYAAIFAKYNLTPPVKTIVGFAERLVEQFGENQFDMVHARNCIDHSYDPALAMEQMVAVTKPGGVVYMHHAVNEATTQAYTGFHQWNLHGTEDCLYVSNSKQIVNMTWRLARVATITNQIFGQNEWIVTRILKRPPAPLLTNLQQTFKTVLRARPGLEALRVARATILARAHRAESITSLAD